eukprot:Platyproteum_vivax@DN2762_c0_g1_i2.p1
MALRWALCEPSTGSCSLGKISLYGFEQSIIQSLPNRVLFLSASPHVEVYTVPHRAMPSLQSAFDNTSSRPAKYSKCHTEKLRLGATVHHFTVRRRAPKERATFCINSGKNHGLYKPNSILVFKKEILPMYSALI